MRHTESAVDAHRGDLAERLSEVVARRRVAGPRERVRLHRVIEAIRAGLESDAARLQLLGAHDAELVAKARSLQDRLDRILRDIRAMRPGAPSAGPT